MIKKILKNILLLLPIIYSIIKIKFDVDFYVIFCIIYLLFILFYYINKNKNYYSYLLQIGISYIFLDLTFHNINLKLFFNAFKLINIKILLLIIFLSILIIYIRAFKWKYLLKHIKPVSMISLFKTVIVGYMVNSILPARAGEVYRAFFLNKLEKISKSTIFATIVLERVFDGLVIGLGVIYILLINIIKNKIFYNIGILSCGIYILAIVMLILFYYNKNFVINTAKRILFFLPEKSMDKLISLFNSFHEGLHIFKSFRNLIFLSIFTFITWCIVGIHDYMFLQSMDIFQILEIGSSHLDFLILLMVCMVIGVSIPSGPGAIGPFHASIFFAFFLINPDYMKSNTHEYNLIACFSMYIWLVQILFFIISGLIILTREHIKLKIK